MSQRIPVFVISLAAAPLRRQRICEHLEKLGLTYFLIDAVDGRSLTAAELAAVDGTGGRSPPGQIGCYLSHFAVYQRIVEQGFVVSLILEDDARLTPRIVPLLRHGLKEWSFDYLFLDCATDSDEGPVFFDASKPSDLGCGLTAFPLSAGPQTTHALMITLDAAKKRLTHALPMRHNIDIYSHLPERFQFAAMLRPKGAYLAEDSLVSFTSARDMRASRPRLTRLRRIPLLLELRDWTSPRYWRSAWLAGRRVKDGTLSRSGRWQPLPSGRQILEISSVALDEK